MLTDLAEARRDALPIESRPVGQSSPSMAGVARRRNLESRGAGS
jgi:hypothetical protein